MRVNHYPACYSDTIETLKIFLKFYCNFLNLIINKGFGHFYINSAQIEIIGGSQVKLSARHGQALPNRGVNLN